MSKELKKEFKEFLEGPIHTPSQGMSVPLFTRVYADLNPSPIKVFTKLLSIHVVVAAFTLLLCPQFGIRLAGEGMGLMNIFMVFGQTGCMVACGTLFMSVSLLVASLVLHGEEVRKIRQNRFLKLGGLALLSLGFFIMIDAEWVLGLAIAWFTGAFIGSLLSLEFGWRLRFKLDELNG